MERLANLVAQLPLDAQVRVPEDGWSPQLRLTARALELSHETYRVLLAGLGVVKHVGQLPAPLRVLPEPPRRKQSPVEAFALLATMRPRGAA